MLELVIQTALEAGRAIMQVYENPETDWQVERKADNSPLTLADRRSHAVIAAALAQTPYPVLSEEGCTSCLQCYMQCPDGTIFKTDNGRLAIDYEFCKGCGICAKACGFGCIQMQPEGGAR